MRNFDVFCGDQRKFESLSTSVGLSPHFFSENSGFDTQSFGAETIQKLYFPSLHVHFFGDWRTISGEIFKF